LLSSKLGSILLQFCLVPQLADCVPPKDHGVCTFSRIFILHFCLILLSARSTLMFVAVLSHVYEKAS
jgi:uncharacterized protein with PQ loop repeat